jgi:hypothetical protein
MARDILKNEDGTLAIQNGDLQIGDGDLQNLYDLSVLNRGEIKYDPLAGMDIVKLNKKRLPDRADLAMVNRQLNADNWVNQKVSNIGGEISIQAERKE